MDISALPTDSLYKFMALSGISICLFTVYFIWTQHQKLLERRDRLIPELAVLEVSLQQLKNKTTEIKQQVLSAKTASTKDKIDNSGDSIKENESQPDQQTSDLESAVTALEISTAKHQRVAKRMESNSKILILYRKQINRLIVLMVILGFWGVGLSISGFYFWYVRIQVHIDNAIVTMPANNSVNDSAH